MATAMAHNGPNRRLSRPSPAIVALAVLGLIGVTYSTLCPIGLRPHLAGANQERFVAYAVLGAVVSRAAGRRWLAATAIVVGLALGLEAAQALAPGRHATLPDAMVKALGGVLGCGLAQLAYPVRRLMALLERHAELGAKETALRVVAVGRRPTLVTGARPQAAEEA